MNKVVEPVATATLKEVRCATDPASGARVEIRNDLVRRLRGEYASGPTMPSGEPEFGWRKFGEPSPIQREAADEIERLRKERAGLLAICKIFLGHDERFQVAVGGNPIAVDKMLDHARAVLLQATKGSGSND